jgi:hypothetical protein
MATDLTGLEAKIKASIVATAQKAVDPDCVAEAPLDKTDTLSPTFGSGDNAADQMWHDRRTLAGAATEDLDLAGVEPNAFGTTVTFAKIKAIFIHNTSDDQDTPTDASMTIGNAAATQFVGPFGAAAHTLTLEAGDWVIITCLKAGWACTGGALDLLKILNNDATDQLQYDIVLLGVSA